jgi:tripartite-type tricarboxylate transporter receptor subunit TctC
MNATARRFAPMLALFSLLATGTPAIAQAPWPQRAIRLVVPAGPGDGTDVVARLVGRPLAEGLGQPVVIENRAGAGGSIASALVASAPADGYTLLLANASSHAVTPGLYPSLPYDAVRDFAPVSLIATSPNVLVVNPATPGADLAGLLAWARSHPGKLDIASAGNGSLSHLAVEMFRRQARIDAVNVGYKAAAPALTDLVAGQVGAMIINLPSTLPLVKAGKLRALAVTSLQRTGLMPGVPSLAEGGLTGYETLAWFGLLAPARTPAPVIERLNTQLREARARAEVREALTTLGAEASPDTPEAFGAFIRADIAKYGAVIREAGIRVE